MALVAAMLLSGCATPEARIGFAGGVPKHAVSLDRPPTAIDGHFTLVDTTGQERTLESFAGRAMLVYIGYSSCISFCGLELASMAAAADLAGAGPDDVALVFVSVDPGRDTPDRLASFTAFFDPDMVGLTGDDRSLDTAAKNFGAYFRRNDDFKGSATYTVDHSTFVYLLDQKGKLVRAFAPFTPTRVIAAALRDVVDDAARQPSA